VITVDSNCVTSTRGGAETTGVDAQAENKKGDTTVAASNQEWVMVQLRVEASGSTMERPS
jgi:hypothetical protein